MATLNPFEITVYSKHHERKGWIGAPVSATFTPRFCAQGTGQIVLRPDDPILEHIIDADGLTGARATVRYKGEHLMSGPFWGAQGSVLPNRPVTLQVRDDWMLTDNPAYIAPSGRVTPANLSDIAQAVATGTTTAGTIDNQSGYMEWPGSLTSREAAVKWVLEANLRTRLGMDVRPLPNQNRGGAPTGLPQLRIPTLAEAVKPILEAGGLGLRIWHELGDDHLSMETWTPRVYPQKLTARAGVVRDGDWSLNPPEITRALVGGPGELAARAFWSVVDSVRESRFGLVLERMRDATSGDLKWGTTATELKIAKYYLLRPEVAPAAKVAFTNYLNAAGLKGLDEGAPSSGLSVQLSDTKTFHFGGDDGYHLGDQITVAAQGIEFTDRIREVSLSLSSKGKFRVTPVVGERKDDPTRQLIRAVASLAASQRRAAFNR